MTFKLVAAVSPELQQDLDPGLSSSSDDSISEEADSESDDGSNPLGDLSYREFDEYVPHLDLATGEIETICQWHSSEKRKSGHDRSLTSPDQFGRKNFS